jgi:ankyrin repeat protein
MESQSGIYELPPLKLSEHHKFRQRNSLIPMSNSVEKQKKSKSYALHQSILDGRLNQLNYFLKMGFKVSTKDKYGRTCLMLACLSNHELYGIQVAKLLLNYGADVNDQDSLGRTALFIACSENREKLFDYLIDNYCSTLDLRLKDHDGNVLFNHVAAYGSTKMLRKVLDKMKEKSVELDHRNNAGFTALLLALQNDRFLNAYVLVKNGKSSTSMKDNEKRMNAIEWLIHRLEANKNVLLNENSKNMINHEKNASNTGFL